MNKNDIVRLKIEDLGSEGEGIGKIDGFTLFVKDAIPGDEIEAKIIKLKKNYGYGRVERIVESSPFRADMLCENARRCGGCQIMEMRYDRQLLFKNNKVKNNIVRIGGFKEAFIDSIMEPIIGMTDYNDKSERFADIDYELQAEKIYAPLRYRNKSQYPVGFDKEGNIISGFYAGRTHSIIKNDDCKLGPKCNSKIMEIIISFMKEYNIKPYDEETRKGYIRHVLIRKGFTTGEIMVCLVINSDNLPKSEKLVNELIKIEGIKSISYSINKANTNVIMGDNYHVIWGKSCIEDLMNVNGVNIRFEISPLSFYQVNPLQVEKLYSTAIDFAGLTGKEEVWDLCCGIGTITLAMASKALRVHGIEIVPQAIEDAKKNMKNNNITNAEFICAPAEEYLPAHANTINADVVVMDPPRKGMDEAALEVVVKAAPKRIVYVSCDSATLARDLKYICDNGYELKRIRACDMFPHSVHVETVCLLSRKAPV